MNGGAAKVVEIRSEIARKKLLQERDRDKLQVIQVNFALQKWRPTERQTIFCLGTHFRRSKELFFLKLTKHANLSYYLLRQRFGAICGSVYYSSDLYEKLTYSMKLWFLIHLNLVCFLLKLQRFF